MAADTASRSPCRECIFEKCKARYHQAPAFQNTIHSDGPGTPDKIMQNGLPRSHSVELPEACQQLCLTNGHVSESDSPLRSSPFSNGACSSSSSQSSPGSQQQGHMQPVQQTLSHYTSHSFVEALGPPVPARISNPGEPLLEDNTNRYTLSPIE